MSILSVLKALVTKEANMPNLTEGTNTGLRTDRKGALYVHGEDSDARIDSMTIADRIVVLSSEITRPSDTTAYASGDVISSAAGANFVFTGANKKVDYTDASDLTQTIYKGGYIGDIMLLCEQAIAYDITFTVQFFSSLQTIVDNAAYSPTYAQAKNLIHEVILQPRNYNAREAVRISKTYNGSFENIYAVLRVNSAFTPTSGSKFFLITNFIQNP